jgi:ammonium transporter, Amt family
MIKRLRILTITGMAIHLACMLLGNALYAQNATASPSPASPVPSLEQRVAGLEAYLLNGDPTSPLKDKDGNIPKDLTTPSVGTSGQVITPG